MLNLKLTPRMLTALENMRLYGDYELWELRYWNTWNAAKDGQCAPSIRTDTMKGLVKRGLVQEKYDKTRSLYKWTAMLTDASKRMLVTFQPKSADAKLSDNKG